MRTEVLTKAGSVLLLLTLLCAAFCSCQQPVFQSWRETEAQTTAADPVQTRDLSKLPETAPPADGKKISDLSVRLEEAENAVKELEKRDFSGNVYMVAIADTSAPILAAEESAPLFYAYSKRNGIISDYFKNTFYFNVLSAEELKSGLSASIKAGGTGTATYFADMLELPAEGAASLAVSGLLMNLRQLPFYNVPTDGIAGSGLYGTKNYFDATSRATSYVTDTLCLFFNRDMIGEEASAKLYSAAFDNKFSFELILNTIKEAKTSADGHAIAINADTELLGSLAMIRSGLSFTEQENDFPVLSATVKSADALDKLISDLLSVGVYGTPAIIPEDSSATDSSASSGAIASSAVLPGDPVGSSAIAKDAPLSPYDTFVSGKSAFYIGTVEEVLTLSDAKIKWGILPLPDDSGKAPNIEKRRSVFCVPANNARLEMTGALMTAYDTLPTEWMGDMYMTICAEHVPDNNSFFTLSRLLCKESFCDFSLLYQNSVKNLFEATVGAVSAAALGEGSVASSAIPLADGVNQAIKGLK